MDRGSLRIRVTIRQIKQIKKPQQSLKFY